MRKCTDHDQRYHQTRAGRDAQNKRACNRVRKKSLQQEAGNRQRAAQQNPGSMFAIIGSDEATIARVCEETEGYVLPVNFNAPAQTVIAGETDPVQRAADTLSGMGAKAVKLAVSSGFHSKLMAPAADEFRQAIRGIPVGQPAKPFYSNITGRRLEAGTDLPDYLARHLVSPVHFHQEVSAMLADGIDTFVELGPNTVLTMLIKRNFKQATALNVENLKTLEKLKSTL